MTTLLFLAALMAPGAPTLEAAETTSISTQFCDGLQGEFVSGWCPGTLSDADVTAWDTFIRLEFDVDRAFKDSVGYAYLKETTTPGVCPTEPPISKIISGNVAARDDDGYGSFPVLSISRQFQIVKGLEPNTEYCAYIFQDWEYNDSNVLPLGPFSTQPTRVADLSLQPHLRGNSDVGIPEGCLGQANDFWCTPITHLAADPQSDKVINAWGLFEDCAAGDPNVCGESTTQQGSPNSSELNSLKFDFGTVDPVAYVSYFGQSINTYDDTTPRKNLVERTPENGFTDLVDLTEYYVPHSDDLNIPIDPNGITQAHEGLACNRTANYPDREDDENSDCHYNAVEVNADGRPTGEMRVVWRAKDFDTPAPSGGTQAIWDFTQKQPAELRGLNCTSTNAGGIPYASLLVTPGEIASDQPIRHMLALTAANSWIEGTYIQWDGMHAAGGGTHVSGSAINESYEPPGWDESIHRRMPYGTVTRYVGPIPDSLTPAEKQILTAWRDYGAMLMDGTFGQPFISLTNDALDATTWTANNVRLTNSLALEFAVDFEWHPDFVEVVSRLEDATPLGLCTRTPVVEIALEVTAQCGDLIDNDGDGLSDLDDPGCASTSDNSEFNTSIAGDNLLPFPGFESGNTWTVAPSHQIEGSNPQSGSFALKTDNTGNEPQQTTWSSVVQLESDKFYEVLATAAAQNMLAPTEYSTAALVVEFLNNGVPIAQNEDMNNTEGILHLRSDNPTHDYSDQNLKGRFKLPKGATGVRIGVRTFAGTSGVSYWDSISLAEKELSFVDDTPNVTLSAESAELSNGVVFADDIDNHSGLGYLQFNSTSSATWDSTVSGDYSIAVVYSREDRLNTLRHRLLINDVEVDKIFPPLTGSPNVFSRFVFDETTIAVGDEIRVEVRVTGGDESRGRIDRLELFSDAIVTASENVFPGTNLRWWPGDGTRVEGREFTVPSSHGGDLGWPQHYSELMDERVAASPNHFEVAVPLIIKKYSWNKMLVDDGSALKVNTSAALQRDPTSSLYRQDVMNQLKDALDHFHSKGMKMGLTLNDVHTGQPNSVPDGLRTADYSWTGTGSNTGHWRLRYDKTEVLDLLVNWIYAVQVAFADHPAFYGIIIGEYFLQVNTDTPPNDFNINDFKDNRGRILWERLNSERWTRADNTRVAIYVTHPQIEVGTSVQDLIDNDMGLSESDTDMFANGQGDNGKADQLAEVGSLTRNLQELWEVVPIMGNGDTRYARLGRKSVWPADWVGVGNSPFDLVSNTSGGRYQDVVSPQMFYWYHGQKDNITQDDGPIPFNTIVLRVDEGTHQNEANIRDAQRRFGHGGTDAATWGSAPGVPTGAFATPPPPPPPPPTPTEATYGDTNTRHVPALGIRTDGVNFQTDDTKFADLWVSSGMAQLVSEQPQAFTPTVGGARPMISVKTTWKNIVTNESVAPTGDQATDMTSSYYRAGSGTDTLMNMLDDAAAHPNNPVILFVFAGTASGQPDAVPQWVIDNGWAWVGDDNRSVYVDYLTQGGYDAKKDVFQAILEHYGDHPNFRLAKGEYYYQQQTPPNNDSWTVSKSNAKHAELWPELVALAPLDENGNRATLYLGNPNGVANSVITGSGWGIGFPDPDLFKNGCANIVDQLCDSNSAQYKQQLIYPLAPLLHIGDSQKYRNDGDNTTFIVRWNGLPNPFGYEDGDNSDLTPEEAMWYYGSGGPVPVSDYLQKVDEHVSLASFSAAVGRFGPNGTDAAQWGRTPALLGEAPVEREGTYGQSNVRHVPTLGIRTDGTSFVEDGDDFDEIWNNSSSMAQLLALEPQAFLPTEGGARPMFSLKTTWRKLLTNSNSAPANSAVARDLDNDYYVMGGGARDVLMEILDDAAAHPANPVVTLVLALTSSGQTRSVPEWMINAGYTFGDSPDDRLNMTIPETQQAVLDLMIAVVTHYGDHPNFRVAFDEYFYAGASPGGGWTQAQNDAAWAEVWPTVLAAAPLDADGNRGLVSFINPKGVPQSQILESGMAVGFPDPDFFDNGCGNTTNGECDASAFQRLQQLIFPLSPLLHKGDAGKYGETTGVAVLKTWSGIANPFGYTSGERVPVAIEQAMWYHGSRGPVPASDFLIKITSATTLTEYAAAIRKFGPNGTETAQWGRSPALSP